MQKTFTQKEIPKIAKEIVELLSTFDFSLSTKSATVVALSGDLGAGKTTLTQAIARELGIKENIISPTFILMKRYALRAPRYAFLVHIDAYRLNSADELLNLGWNELVANPKNLILIEWPERVKKIIPKDAVKIRLEHVNEKERTIEIN